MGDESPEVGYQRHGLYYPFFHVRDERWLKVAALYWPKIVRLVPDGYQNNWIHPAVRTARACAARALDDVFLVRRSPGPSVEAVAPRFLDLIATHAEELRARLGPRGDVGEVRRPWWVPRWVAADRGARPTTAVHVNQIAPAVRDALVDAGLAVWVGGSRGSRTEVELWQRWMGAASNPSNEWDHRLWPDLTHQPTDWVLMPEKLVAVYTSVLAEDFAAANKLQPTTDQDDAFAVTNNWTSDRIAEVLLTHPPSAGSPTDGDLAETVGLLALNLVIPANLDTVSFEKIIEVRKRYGAEFRAFGQEVDHAVAGLAELSGIRDRAVLDQYLHDVVTARFGQPLQELRTKIERLTGDAAMMSINVKTELPAAALAGGAWLAGHPLIAGTSAAAIGLMAVRRGMHQQRESAVQSAPAASFLLHTQAHLQPRTLLNRTLHQLTRIAGTSPD